MHSQSPSKTRARAPLAKAALAAAALAIFALAAPGGKAEEIIKAHGISVFGDLKYPPDFTSLDYVNPDAPKGGEIAIWGFGSFDSMHPYSKKGRAGGLSSAFFETLLEGTADETDSGYGLLAESLEYPKDRSWVIFNLRPEARFSDGTPLTAEDVLFSFEILRDKGLPSFRVLLQQQIESAEILGPHRIKYTFKEGVPHRDLPSTVGALPVFSKRSYMDSGRDFEDSSLEPLTGSGPYVLDSMDVGRKIIYKRNPDYWGSHLPINKGRGNFDRVRVEYFADYNTALEGFKSGVYTFRNEASSKNWATAYDFPAVEKGWVVKKELPDGSLASGQSFVMNLRRDKFSDPRVREAIGLMFNFEWSNKTLFYGLYSRINSFWDNSDLAASGPPSEAELDILEPLVEKGILSEEVLGEDAIMAPESSERQLDRGNLRKASRLLDEAGWRVGPDGMRVDGSGKTLKVEIINDSQTFERIINPYIENMRRAGIDAVYTRVDNAQMTNREREHDFDMVTAQFRMAFVPGSGLKQYFGSETAEESVFNVMGLSSEAVDELIEIVMAAKTREKLHVAVKALDRVLRAERFWVPQWHKNVHTIAYYDMFEHPEQLPPYALGTLDFWWHNEEKARRLRESGALSGGGQ